MTTHICNNPNTGSTIRCQHPVTDPAVYCGSNHHAPAAAPRAAGTPTTAAPVPALPTPRRASRTGGILGYTFAADTYCVDCVLSVLPEYHTDGMVGDTRDVHGVVDVDGALWDVAIDSGVDREDEYSFDSDDFPKAILLGMTDEPTECGKCSARIC